MKVAIDYDRCTGHGRCFSLSGELFTDDENGYGQVLHDGVVPDGLEAVARRAQAACPEQAIEVSE